MSDHSTALVPLESWCYHSPELLRTGKQVDIGLMAEALIYYEQVIVDIANQPQLVEFVRWFVEQGKFADLVALLSEGTIQIHHYAFVTLPVHKEGMYILVNIQDEEQAQTKTFRRRFLYDKSLERYLPHARQRAQLYKAVQGRLIEVKASSFGPAIDNALHDSTDPQRSALIIQALLDEIYPILGWKDPPKVEAKIVSLPGKHQISWNVNLKEISKSLGKELNLHLGTPLTAAGLCNRYLWSAADLGCDLYLGSPMSNLVGDKLYESSHCLDRPKNIIHQLVSQVAFPDIRSLTNSGEFGLQEILVWRKKARRFRNWLQEESERDRNAIIAYHNEVAKQGGWEQVARKTLRLFGVLGAAVAGAGVGGAVAGIPGAMVGAGVAEGAKYLVELAAKLNEDWCPVVFGKWAEDRIRKLTDERENE